MPFRRPLRYRPPPVGIGLGLDVGGTKILTCAVSEVGDLVAETRVDSPKSPDLLLEALAQAVGSVSDALGDRVGDVVGVGVGVPSLVAADGALFSTPNLPALEGLPLRAAFAERLAVTTGRTSWRLVLDNDATCAAAGELAFGAARETGDALIITLGTGIGGGIVSGGSVFRGASGFAGEFGHMVIDPTGPACHCGRHGCFEQFASGSALARLARRAAVEGRADRVVALAGGQPGNVRGEHVLDAAREGDPGAEALFAELGRHLAVGIDNLVEVLDPALVVLAGGLAAAGDVLLRPARAAFESSSRRGSGEHSVGIVLAGLGERAGAFGAAALALGVVG